MRGEYGRNFFFFWLCCASEGSRGGGGYMEGACVFRSLKEGRGDGAWLEMGGFVKSKIGV